MKPSPRSFAPRHSVRAALTLALVGALAACNADPIDIQGQGGASASGGVGGAGGGWAGGEGGSWTGGAGGAVDGGAGGWIGGAGGPTTGGAGPTACGPMGEVCGTNQFCEYPAGQCSGPGTAEPGQPVLPVILDPGACRSRPEACTLIYAPVCGCDGVTYGNDCARAGAGVSKLHDGECNSNKVIVGRGEACGTDVRGQRRECASGLFCDPAAGQCGANVTGTCQPNVQVCPAIYRPECGCDAITYGNDCERRAAGVALLHEGECRTRRAGLGERCAGLARIACAEGLVCDQEPNTCQVADATGVCVRAPGGQCPRLYAPVCGCDGRTYGNDCERLRAGAVKQHDGECRGNMLERGTWGGEHVELVVEDPRRGGRVRFDCGRGEINGPLSLGPDGSFRWRGSYARNDGSGSSVQSAEYTGEVQGRLLKLEVRVGDRTATFTAHLGIMPTFFPCL